MPIHMWYFIWWMKLYTYFWPVNIICNSYHKFYRIPQHVGPSQFISRPWPNGSPCTYYSYNVDYLKAQNIIVTCQCVQGGVAFCWLLQLNVMHYFNKIASWHVCPVNVIELLQLQTRLPQRWVQIHAIRSNFGLNMGCMFECT